MDRDPDSLYRDAGRVRGPFRAKATLTHPCYLAKPKNSYPPAASKIAARIIMDDEQGPLDVQ